MTKRQRVLLDEVMGEINDAIFALQGTSDEGAPSMAKIVADDLYSTVLKLEALLEL